LIRIATYNVENLFSRATAMPGQRRASSDHAIVSIDLDLQPPAGLAAG